MKSSCYAISCKTGRITLIPKFHLNKTQKKQIIATYQQQKKANQQAFDNSKQALKTSAKAGKDADKLDDHQNNRMKDKHLAKAKKSHTNKHHTTPKVKKMK